MENKGEQERVARKTKITRERGQEKIVENRKRAKRPKKPKRTEERKTSNKNWMIREKNKFNKEF